MSLLDQWSFGSLYRLLNLKFYIQSWNLYCLLNALLRPLYQLYAVSRFVNYGTIFLSAAICRKWCRWIQCCSKTAHNSKSTDYHMPLQFRGIWFMCFLSLLREFSSPYVILPVLILCWFHVVLVMLHDLTIYFLLAYIQRGPAFIEELLQVIPNSHYVKRGTYELKKVCHFTELRNSFASGTLPLAFKYISFQIVEYAKNRDFTSLIVVHTNRREPGMHSSLWG